VEKKALASSHYGLIDQQLQSARGQQHGAIPPPDAAVGGDLAALEAHDRQRPHDFFWGEDSGLYFVIADVSDKGAGSVHGADETLIRMVRRFRARRVPLEPTDYQESQRAVSRQSAGMFMTVFFGILDPATAWFLQRRAQPRIS
jgi:serine phosphatase RsbU (regulator of sigma subunit)